MSKRDIPREMCEDLLELYHSKKLVKHELVEGEEVREVVMLTFTEAQAKNHAFRLNRSAKLYRVPLDE